MPAIVEYLVMKGKSELARRTVVIEGDAILTTTDGVQPDAAEADVTLTLTPALAEALQAGTLDVSVGFMRGEIKMSGDNAVLFSVLPVLSRTSGW